MIKIFNEVSIERTYLNKTKAIYDKFTANILLNGEKHFTAFPVRSGTRQEYRILPLMQHGIGSPNQVKQI